MKLLTDGQEAAACPAVPRRTGEGYSGGFGQMVRIMKLTCVLLTVAFLHVSAGSYSQQVTLSLKDAPIEKVFREIEKQTGYGFLYNKKMFADFPNVTIDVKNANIKDVLDRCFHASTVEYVMKGQTIVIREKLQPEKGTGSPATPPGEIHGRITDSLGNPLEGVNITIKGTKKGTVSGINGEFTLKAVENDAILIISNVGFESQEIRLGARQDIRVLLRASNSSLDETVVKGYYNTTKRLNTGDVTTVKSEDIDKQPVTDPLLALEGRVPGLYIQQTSGLPGAYGNIHIMGQNSLANGNDPLYIIDGVPFSSLSLTSNVIGGGAAGYGSNTSNIVGGGLSPFNGLNPSDIERIEVLKDADATAIYGSRGANGVILITTKKGKPGNTQFGLNVFTGASTVTRTMDLLDTKQYLAMRREAYQNDVARCSFYSNYPHGSHHL